MATSRVGAFACQRSTPRCVSADVLRATWARAINRRDGFTVQFIVELIRDTGLKGLGRGRFARDWRCCYKPSGSLPVWAALAGVA